MVAATLSVLIGTQAAPQTKTRNDDAVVVRAAVNAFFAPARDRWARGNWDRGGTVVIATQLRSRARASIAELVGGIPEQDWNQDRMPGAPHYRDLRAASWRRGAFRPPTIVPMRTLDLGPNAIVADHPWPDALRFDPPLPGKRKGGGRAWLNLHPPAYSGDGRIAALKTWANSNHGSEILFVMRREDRGWRMLYVGATFFV